MLLKKILAISTLVIISCGYTQLAQACEDRLTRAAFGSLEKRDLDELKRRYRSTSVKFERDNVLDLGDVQSILGFLGEQTKTTNNGRIEHRIWIDYENCNRQIKASFSDRELVKIQSYGF